LKDKDRLAEESVAGARRPSITEVEAKAKAKAEAETFC